MTIEERLTDALHQADEFDPSLDLFARVGRSITEDLAHRRRLLKIYFSILLGLVLAVGYFALVVSSSPQGLTIAAWEIELFRVAVLGVLVIVLAPNIRRFARSYVTDLFHLSPETGDRFLAVLDVAYYLVFFGLILVDADFGHPEAELALGSALNNTAFAFGVFFLAMGLLHVANIVSMPFIGLIFNSLMRVALRHEAGSSAPPETLRAMSADRNARAFVIGLVVVVLALAVTLLMGPILGGVLG
jgi:hypothetical protein